MCRLILLQCRITICVLNRFSFPPIPNAAPLPIENTTDEIVGSIFHVHTDVSLTGWL